MNREGGVMEYVGEMSGVRNVVEMEERNKRKERNGWNAK